MKHIKLFEDFSGENVIELSNGYTIVGPMETAEAAKEMAERINSEMDSVYDEYLEIGGESRAMDERDDVVYNFEEELAEIGYRIEA
jgi:hypothetical protein